MLRSAAVLPGNLEKTIQTPIVFPLFLKKETNTSVRGVRYIAKCYRNWSRVSP